jgi:CrcB protein
MKMIFLAGAGSCLGGIARYLLQTFLSGKIAFPYGTFCVNIAGCFFIGLIFAFSTKLNFSNETKLFLTTGILGGFTTFSAFSNETLLLLKNSQFAAAAVYVTLSVIVGLIATATGYWAAK